MRRYVLAVCLALFVAASVRFGVDHYQWMKTSSYEQGRDMGYYEGEMKRHGFLKWLARTAKGMPVYFQRTDKGIDWKIEEQKRATNPIGTYLFTSGVTRFSVSGR